MKKLLTLSLMLLSVSGTHTYNTKLHPFAHDGIRIFNQIPTTMYVGKPVSIKSYHDAAIIGFSFENKERAKKNVRFISRRVGTDNVHSKSDVSNEYLKVEYNSNGNTYTFTPLKATTAPTTLHCSVAFLTHGFDKQITILPATASPQPTQQSTQPTTPQNN